MSLLTELFEKKWNNRREELPTKNLQLILTQMKMMCLLLNLSIRELVLNRSSNIRLIKQTLKYLPILKLNISHNNSKSKRYHMHRRE